MAQTHTVLPGDGLIMLLLFVGEWHFAAYGNTMQNLAEIWQKSYQPASAL